MSKIIDPGYTLGILFTYGGTQPLYHSNGFGNYDCQMEITKEYSVKTSSWNRYINLFWFDANGDEIESEEIDEKKARELFWAEMQRDMTDSFTSLTLPDLIDEEVKEIDICTCTMRALTMNGCSCGQIERERGRK